MAKIPEIVIEDIKDNPTKYAIMAANLTRLFMDGYPKETPLIEVIWDLDSAIVNLIDLQTGKPKND